MPRPAVCVVVDPRTVSKATPLYSQATVPSPGLIPTMPAFRIWNISPSGQQIGACCNELVFPGVRYEALQTSFNPETLFELICFNCENNVDASSPPGKNQSFTTGCDPFGRYAFAPSAAGVACEADRDADANATVVAATTPAATAKYSNLRIFANPPKIGRRDTCPNPPTISALPQRAVKA